MSDLTRVIQQDNVVLKHAYDVVGIYYRKNGKILYTNCFAHWSDMMIRMLEVEQVEILNIFTLLDEYIEKNGNMHKYIQEMNKQCK